MTPFLLLDRLGALLYKILKDVPLAYEHMAKVYTSNAPMPHSEEDEDIFPYCLVRLGEGTNSSNDTIQEITVIFAAFDEADNRGGFNDVVNMIESVRQYFCKYPDFESYSVLEDMKWIYPEDNEQYPYFFGAILLKVALPRIKRVSNYL